MEARSSTLRDLTARLRRLIDPRWAAAGIAGATPAFRWLGRIPLPVRPLLLVAIALAAVNGPCWLDLRRRGPRAIETRRQASQNARESDEAKARHLRRVGHQLRAPLGAVDTLLLAASEDLSTSGDTEARHLVERARARAQEMLRLVDDLLALLRDQGVHLETVARPVRLDSTAQRVVQLSAREAAAKGIAIEMSLAPDLPSVRGDPVGLEDLLTNLLANAIRYTPAGGRIGVRITSRDERAIIEVKDTGIGIAPVDLAHIFEEYYRSEDARALVREGSGLGLAIVRSVVEAHDGDIAVKSAPGEGTTFTVRLPLAARSVGTAGRPPVSVRTDDSSRRNGAQAFHRNDSLHALPLCRRPTARSRT